MNQFAGERERERERERMQDKESLSLAAGEGKQSAETKSSHVKAFLSHTFDSRSVRYVFPFLF